MNPKLFKKAIKAIDSANAKDPNIESYQQKEYPKELLYADRMLKTLLQFEPSASEELQIATRAQHIERWKISRKSYPENRIGYLKWREDLKKMHAEKTSAILKEVGYDDAFTERVSFLIKKKLLKKDNETQTLEDVACLVFLQFYFEEFSEKHSEDKVIDILQKTWNKMSEKGHEAALKLPLSKQSLVLIKKALA